MGARAAADDDQGRRQPPSTPTADGAAVEAHAVQDVRCVGPPLPCCLLAQHRTPTRVPEQHDVGLRPVDGVVLPAARLLHAEGPPLVLCASARGVDCARGQRVSGVSLEPERLGGLAAAAAASSQHAAADAPRTTAPPNPPLTAGGSWAGAARSLGAARRACSTRGGRGGM
jgi:hypothetical protein